MPDLPDANVWIALTSAEHEFHQPASEYWIGEAEGPVAFCRTTALALTRILSNRHTLGGPPLPFAESWRRYRDWRGDSGITFFDEPSGVEEPLARFIHAGLVTSKNSTDAYLAAFAITAGLRLVTFDKDFGRFPGLNYLPL
jgi:toxin-antitoxin system PIN domain toxin